MANRIDGNVYILDSQLNALSLPWPSKAKVMAAAGWFSGPTGEAQLSGALTNNIVIRLAATLSAGASIDRIYLGGVSIDSLGLPILTAGTAWIYFG